MPRPPGVRNDSLGVVEHGLIGERVEERDEVGALLVREGERADVSKRAYNLEEVDISHLEASES